MITNQTCRCHEYILLGEDVCIRANILRCFCSLVIITLTTVFALFRLLVLIRSRVRFRFAREILKSIEMQKRDCQTQKNQRTRYIENRTLSIWYTDLASQVSFSTYFWEMSAISDQLRAQFSKNLHERKIATPRNERNSWSTTSAIPDQLRTQ